MGLCVTFGPAQGAPLNRYLSGVPNRYSVTLKKALQLPNNNDYKKMTYAWLFIVFLATGSFCNSGERA